MSHHTESLSSTHHFINFAKATSFAESDGDDADALKDLFALDNSSEAYLTRKYNLLEAFRPIIDDVLSSLTSHINKSNRIPEIFGGTTEKAVDLLLPSMLRRIGIVANKTLILELNVARVSGQLDSDNSQKRFEQFVANLSSKEKQLSLIDEYGPLFLLVRKVSGYWLKNTKKMLCDLENDWSSFFDMGFLSGDKPIVTSVESGAGDVHCKGKSVSIFTFSQGQKLVYKPRNGLCDKAFAELLQWIEQKGFHKGFKIPKIIADTGRTWCEFVAHDGCDQSRQLNNFYYRLGGLLAVFYALRATDFHCENIIANGEYPVPIDFETLFHIDCVSTSPDKFDAANITEIGYSVLNIGLLPNKVWAAGEHLGVDNSGIGGKSGQLLPVARQKCVDVETDTMHVTSEKGYFEAEQHRPLLNGKHIDPHLYTDDIVAGFSHVYRIISEHKSELQTKSLTLFEQVPIRSVMRPTQVYARLLFESFHPDLFRSGETRRKHFELLQMDVKNRPALTHIVSTEIDEMLRADIPLFLTTPFSRDLFSSDGEKIESVLHHSAMERVKATINSMDEEDLGIQNWITRAAMSTLEDFDFAHNRYKELPAIGQSKQPLRNAEKACLSNAIAIGETISTYSLNIEGRSNWLAHVTKNGLDWDLSPGDMSLYQGTAGICLFLAYLGEVSEQKRFTDLARRALNTLEESLDKEMPMFLTNNVGLMSGWGGLLYLMGHLYSLWKEPRLISLVDKILCSEPFNQALEHEQFDVMEGQAGLLFGLGAVQHVSPNSQTQALIQSIAYKLCDSVRENAQGAAWYPHNNDVALLGLAHGTSGVIAALAAVSQWLDDENYLSIIHSVICYENAYIDADSGNWMDLRQKQASVERTMSGGNSDLIAWCHGGAGVGISRVIIHQNLSDKLPDDTNKQVLSDISRAMDIVKERGFSKSHCLCHGAMGNLAFLARAQSLYCDGNTLYDEHVLSAIFEHQKAHGWQSGIPLSSDCFGLMVGTSGMGLAMLHHAFPERVPCVVNLDKPIV